MCYAVNKSENVLPGYLAKLREPLKIIVMMFPVENINNMSPPPRAAGTYQLFFYYL